MKYASLLFIFVIVSCATPRKAIIEEPKHNKNNYIQHMAYSLVYNELNEQADWVTYELLDYEMEPIVKRTDKFLMDTMVVSQSANNADYSHSGYDRGHLAPAADMSWNAQAMKESFYYSNISPQLAAFNRGIWKDLESQVRDWATKYGSIYIVTGPVFENTKTRIGENKVAVPTHFYKAAVVNNDSIHEGIAFYFPHEKCKGDIFDYVLSIDELEKITRMNLFHDLPNRIERKIESQIELKYWE